MTFEYEYDTKKKELDNELDTLYEIKSKGAQIRWRVKLNDEGEKKSSWK